VILGAQTGCKECVIFAVFAIAFFTFQLVMLTLQAGVGLPPFPAGSFDFSDKGFGSR
jgi:hypothetical protein